MESGVAALSLLPGPVSYPVSNLIDQYVAEQQQAALLSGRASASDIAAGFALGQAVAAVFVARAGNDGLEAAATGTAPQWQALADAATARGEIPVERALADPTAASPCCRFSDRYRPGAMKPPPTLLPTNCPGPPPSTSSSQLKQQTAVVKSTVENLTREQLAIATKWADGVSSPTPPGHWNFIAESYIAGAGFSEVRAARAFALLDMTLMDAAVACWDTKFFYFNPRPEQMDPSIKTVIGLPNFPSYESGHSAFSGAADAVLTYLFPSGKAYFDAQAQEAAISRLYGGIHYQIDNEAGLTHGTRVGGYTVRLAQQDGADPGTGTAVVTGQTLDGASFHSRWRPAASRRFFRTVSRRPQIWPARFRCQPRSAVFP